MTTGARSPRRRTRVWWAARLGALAVRALGLTWRVTRHGYEHVTAVRRARRTVVFTTWHGEMLPLLWGHRNERVHVLVSTHADGEIITRIAASLGFGAVRGSSNRGGARALLEMADVLSEGFDVAVTPDGPRGPRHSFAPGALVAAQRAGAPIIAARAVVDRAWRLRSWDRFVIPKPFARVTLLYSAPELVNGDSARDAEAQVDRFERLLSTLAPGDAA
jgi:lysophospholipid acyltransferase (LPLAT)-like uncharacterized protein